MDQGRKLTLIDSGYNKKDYRIVNLNASNIKTPTNIDLSSTCSPIKNQGSIGACTSFSTIGVMEFISKKNKISLNPLSERFAYYATRMNIMNNPDTSDTGSSIRDALKSVVKYGTCFNSLFPYNGDYKIQPSQSIYTQALKNCVISYARYDDIDSVGMNQLPTTINTLKVSLSAGIPIIAGFTCYSNLYNAVKGVIPPAKGDIIGGHAIMIVGYDDSKKLFKFKNSWGTSWGVNGYGFLPYSYYLSGDMYDIWSIYSQLSNLSNVGLNVINTKVQKQIVQNKIQDILDAFSTTVGSTTDTTIITNQTNALLSKYKSDNVVNLVNNISSQVIQLLK